MNKYIFSIDPGLKCSGFVLWEIEIFDSSKSMCEIYKDGEVVFARPIWVGEYNFVKFVKNNYSLLLSMPDTFYKNIDNTKIFIERGIYNPKFGQGKETLDHLRGFICGQLNKLLTKDMLISPRQWQCWYLKQLNIKKWDKELSINEAQRMINELSWNIDIKNNHNIAEALLIGWYVINERLGSK